jgi:hypothetical protein
MLEKKINNIIEMSEALAEIPAGAYHSPSRETTYQLCRAAGNNLIMRELGIDYNELSHYIKSRNRATLYTNHRNHNKYLHGWERYRLFYSSLKAQFLALNKEGEYIDRDGFDLILTRNGIPSTLCRGDDTINMRITVSIGHFEGKLYRTNTNVSTAVKKLIQAFYEYAYNISITKIKKYERIHKTT